MSKYRREIDGLRALAVIPVILFHADFSILKGGFVGVDIFFVISGYLITSLIINDLEKNRFSLLHFYERRARRILPALIVITLCCFPFAWYYLLPSELIDFSKSVISSNLFISNVQFWLSTNYFSTDASLIPLLHTWSLSVEEQYYIVFPLLLLILWRTSHTKLLFFVLIGLAISSFLFSTYIKQSDPAANFYLLPSRTWELLSGAIIAIYYRQHSSHSIKSATLRQYASLIGLLTILGSFFLIDTTLPFPGLYTLFPVCGTLLIIIFATPDTWAGRLLSHPIMVGIGLISYSAYLWHQPIFAFARIIILDTPSHWLMLLLCFLSLLLAWGTWYWVEQPCRNQARTSTMQILKGVSAGILLLIIMSSFFILLDGVPQRF